MEPTDFVRELSGDWNFGWSGYNAGNVVEPRYPQQVEWRKIMENESLIADLVGWVSKESRTYQDAMDAWRTSCPRLSIWEDAVDHGFIKREIDENSVPIVRATAKGIEFLKSLGRQAA